MTIRQSLTKIDILINESLGCISMHVNNDRATMNRQSSLPERFERPQILKCTREGLACSLRLEPYESRIVLPHERTHAGPKEGRLKLVRAVRGPIILITIGTLFALDHMTPYGVHETWPVILIVVGLLTLVGRATRSGPPAGGVA